MNIIEPLEARIAPASIVTYTDIDGDIVKVTASAGPLDITDFTLSGGTEGIAQVINLTDPSFAAANLTFAVKRQPGGDGFAHIGHINATGVDLGVVTVKGDLGRITSGNAVTADGPALKTLAARSLGLYGLTTQPAGGSLLSEFLGSLGAVKIATDIRAASITADSIGSLALGGSLMGGSATASGQFFAVGEIGPVKIAGDIVGGSGNNSGMILSPTKIASAAVGGKVKGGNGAFSGALRAGEFGLVKIGGDLQGGLGVDSGSITSLDGGSIAGVKIGGSLSGGAGVHSGRIAAGTREGIGGSDYGTLGPVLISGSLEGGGGSGSGRIFSEGDAGMVGIKGSLIGGAGGSSGTVKTRASVAKITIAGSIHGGSGTGGASISAGLSLGDVSVGQDVVGGSGGSTSNIFGASSIGKIKIGGSVLGYGFASAAFASNGSIGAVNIGRDFRGGDNNFSGAIDANALSDGVFIRGSLVGGTATFTGVITADVHIGTIRIGRDFVGGSISGSASIGMSGAIASDGGYIASITIGGSIIAGVDTSSGTLDSAVIHAKLGVQALTVKGSILGNVAGDLSLVKIGAQQGTGTLAESGVCFRRITVGGTVAYTQILAGYDRLFNEVSGAVQIGPVTVGRDWIASSMVAGVGDGISPGYGDAVDVLLPGGSVSRIASVLIKGIVVGSAAAGDSHGFVAKEIGSLKVGAVAYALQPGTVDAPHFLAPVTRDVIAREL